MRYKVRTSNTDFIETALRVPRKNLTRAFVPPSHACVPTSPWKPFPWQPFPWQLFLWQPSPRQQGAYATYPLKLTA